MLRPVAFVLLVCALVSLSACDPDDDGPSPPNDLPFETSGPTVVVQVSPPPRPTDVPLEATPIVQTARLGAIMREDPTPQAEALRTLTDASCVNDILTLHTTLETVYAALTCDLFSAEQFAAFLNKDASVTLEVQTDRFRILIETMDGSQAQFTPTGIWVE
jgi:hypothetical protein